MHRVQKLLSNYGYCSRRRAEDLIKDGRVKVNGEVISIGDQATEKDEICVDDELVYAEKKVYLIFNKPHGCVTAVFDDRYKTVMEYIDVDERVFPVGRLDYNTTGLLIFTNDGDFANNIMHPRYEIQKTYMGKVGKPVSRTHIVHLERGVELEDGQTSKAKVVSHEPNRIELTIHEGKNRIVRRMMGALGFDVLRLERIQIGGLKLGDLEVGTYKNLTEEDKKKIFEK